MLLPLPVARVRAMSLENHLALAAMCNGHGNVDLMTCLIKALYLTYFMRDAVQDSDDLALLREAEAALERSVTRVENLQKWSVAEDDRAVVEQTLALYDRQLASAPAHRHMDASDRLADFFNSDMRSPIATGGVANRIA
ncbi:hypothetical protein EOS_36005 [Caballeronia mineralivorans PML1(12)]|uniref:Fis family transcriptional regulator n=2 Tax=Caballeronia mineralivorans TaxID=2010198 RepID=A0A0J1FNX3_9BURK|nr:hypothetical protein EOS_36005 [Caballeronia mineralivorans PML1(12)]